MSETELEAVRRTAAEPSPLPGKGKRIWELDAFRGVCILCVIVVHFIFDLQLLFGILTDMPPVYDFIQMNGGILFIVLSGICVTLGSHNLRRGLIVAGGAAVITGVTVLLFDRDLYILFGILHLLSFCMLTYSLYRRLPPAAVFVIGAAVLAAGYWFNTFYVKNPFLFMLGLRTKQFASADYFPIFPYLGYFMIGTGLGKTVYKKKQTLFPVKNEKILPLRFLSFCGRHSFLIYLLHQPIVFGLCLAAKQIIG